MFIAVVLELAGVSALAFAVGVYLPLSTSVPIFVGGLVRAVVDRVKQTPPEETETSPGVLLASGYIAGRRDRGHPHRRRSTSCPSVLNADSTVAQVARRPRGTRARWPSLVAFGADRSSCSSAWSAPADLLRGGRRRRPPVEEGVTAREEDRADPPAPDDSSRDAPSIEEIAAMMAAYHEGSSISAVMAALACGTVLVHADEGMWLFNNPPRELLKEKYGFEPTDGWLEHVQTSAVRFNSGGSGSFVSADGLVMTNHHVGADTLQKLSTKEKDYFKDGFHAKTRAEEVKAPDLELNVLVDIEDVTDRVNAAVKPGMDDADGRRRPAAAAMAEIEKESLEKTGLRSDVVTLYQGGQYHLYRFKKYTDVRLVFAPEQDIAFFGGDPDNFEFPRYDLDVCFFRVYEDDKPAKIEHYLKWSKDGRKDGELVFVAGHPGRTNRLNTVADLEYLRDIGFPLPAASVLHRLEVLLLDYGERGRGERPAGEGRPVRRPEQPQGPHRRPGRAARTRRSWPARPRTRTSCASGSRPDPEAARTPTAPPGTRSPRRRRSRREIARTYTLLEARARLQLQLFGIARTLVRAGRGDGQAQRRAAPRVPRLGPASRSKLQLFSDAPIYAEFETVKLADSLAYWMASMLGRRPAGAAGPRAASRPRAGGRGAGQRHQARRRRRPQEARRRAARRPSTASDDPMIELARLVDADARAVRKVVEDQVEERKRQAYAKIAKAKFADRGRPTSIPTPPSRCGWPSARSRATRRTASRSRLHDDRRRPYEHAEEHGNKPPFDLPPSWLEAQGGKLEPDDAVQLRLHGRHHRRQLGQPGGQPRRRGRRPDLRRQHPVAGARLRLRRQAWPAPSRSTRAAIIEALRSIYGAEALVEELTGKR